MQQYYTKIIHDLRDALGLTNNEYVVIDTINRLTDEEDWCKKSREKIGSIAGISKRSTIKIVDKYSDADLEDARLLEKNSTGKVRATELWNLMVRAITIGQEVPEDIQKSVKKVHRINEPNGEESSPDTVKKVHQNGEESSPPSINTHKNKQDTLFGFGPGEESSPEPQDEKNGKWYGKSLEELFDLFWKYYPDRGPNYRNPKQRSKKYFKRLLEKEGEDPQKIIKGAVVFRAAMADREGDDRQGIPMSSTWLNDKEYLDWWEQYDSRSVSRKQKAIEAGGMTKEQAQQYAQEKFREPLASILGQFQILEFEDETIYIPQ